MAAVAVARAIKLGPEAVQGLKDLGKGYSQQKDAAPRDLPSDALILEVIDALPSDWQWAAGICATYGTRPHEALLMADVESIGLVVIRGGKTGARQGLPLPKEWIARWALQTKRLPRINAGCQESWSLVDGAHQLVLTLVRQCLDGFTCEFAEKPGHVCENEATA
ncbi:hypothetical protein [Synechococcus sp. BA-132 BA5]|uniref:hypothetical protein n=1 Tax=Synechococcus sp. BA-132 BA5 TaxID=3110252 RepID=UPI002B1FE8E8|nr:hypothetical protein [Synechococcus sp. BA-132 BA5]MEA5415022.1 hypothetical protein [Synechococcus sp. BA-132 BA5]